MFLESQHQHIRSLMRKSYDTAVARIDGECSLDFIRNIGRVPSMSASFRCQASGECLLTCCTRVVNYDSSGASGPRRRTPERESTSARHADLRPAAKSQRAIIRYVPSF